MLSLMTLPLQKRENKKPCHGGGTSMSRALHDFGFDEAYISKAYTGREAHNGFW
jgi:hypothetical protein